MNRKLAAEFLGTFWLVFGGCGSAIFAAKFPELGIGFAGVSLAFGLTVLTMAYAVGPISGGHFNPAVTVGLWAGGRISSSEVLPYVLAQVAGARAAAAALWMFWLAPIMGGLIGGWVGRAMGEKNDLKIPAHV
ncbi:aquaporin [Pseudomonas sp. CFBP 8771]|nr:aquaporin [Pseudomonas sp. CFBP 8771]MBD8731368.1 aquaporin [Pseudomonas sp. CFBP 13710]